MKKNFKKVLSVLLVTLMLCSVFSVCVLAAGPYTITLGGGYRTLNNVKYVAEFSDEIVALGAGIEGDTFTFTKDGVVYTADRVNNVITFETDAAGKFTFPEYFFKLTGYEQEAWGTKESTNSGNNKTGKTLTVKKNTTYYGRFVQAKYTVDYIPGDLADASNVAKSSAGNTYGKTIKLPADIFTRAGHIQIGWAYQENSTVADFDLEYADFVVTENVALYPVWQKMSYSLSCDVDTLIYDTVCEDYSEQPSKTFEIKNNSNTSVTLTLPSDAAFLVTSNGSLTIPANGGSVEITVRPQNGLVPGTYSANLDFNFGIEDINFVVKASFAVLEHRFENYKSNDDATYEADGTKTATCIFGCGAENTIADAGSMKVYDIANNAVKGLLKEYLYHKTVDCVAYGSGSDYTAEEIEKATAEGKELYRFRPVSWYVNDEHNGEFTEGNYKINYVHTDFGSYTLTIKYVEEKLVDGEWVATDVEDEKSFNYSIGPSAKDEVEVVRPNMIVNIVFALLGYLVDAIGGLLG